VASVQKGLLRSQVDGARHARAHTLLASKAFRYRMSIPRLTSAKSRTSRMA